MFDDIVFPSIAWHVIFACAMSVDPHHGASDGAQKTGGRGVAQTHAKSTESRC